MHLEELCAESCVSLLGRLLRERFQLVIREEGWPLPTTVPFVKRVKIWWTISFFIFQRQGCCGIYFFLFLEALGLCLLQ